MDSKLQVLSDSVALVANKMEFICSLASELQLSQEISESLLSAKNSLSDCKILIQVQLIHVTSNTITFDDDHIDQEDIKRTKIFLVPNDLDPSAAAHVNVLKKENNVKIENENPPQSFDIVVHQVLDNLDSYEPDGAVESLENAELDSRLVETKIEVEDDIPDLDLPLLDDLIEEPTVRRKRKRKSNGQAEKPSKKSDGHTEKRGRKPKTVIEPIIVAANSDFQDDEDFSQHMLNPDGGEIDENEAHYLCPICGKTKETRIKFRDHVRAHKTKIKCLQCPAMVPRYEMSKHANEMHGGPPPKVAKTFCRHCYKSFPDEEFKVHETVCGPIQVQCAVCGKICNGRKNHTDHMRIHNRPAIYPCDLCDKKFRTVGEMTRHKTHKHIDLKTCEICGQDGMSIYNLKHHMKIHDQNRERQFSCDECGMSFHKIHGLKAHMSTHSEAKPFTCDVCNKAFKYKNSLVTHLKLHNEETPRVKCEHCGRAFTIKKYLRKHQRQVHKISFSSVRAKRSTN